jgi:hypothetical protein
METQEKFSEQVSSPRQRSHETPSVSILPKPRHLLRPLNDPQIKPLVHQVPQLNLHDWQLMLMSFISRQKPILLVERFLNTSSKKIGRKVTAGTRYAGVTESNPPLDRKGFQPREAHCPTAATALGIPISGDYRGSP